MVVEYRKEESRLERLEYIVIGMQVGTGVGMREIGIGQITGILECQDNLSRPAGPC